MGIFDKLKGAVKGHGDKVGEGLDKAADVADEKTGGKHSEHIDTGVDKAKEQLGIESEPGGEAPAEQAEAQQDEPGQGGPGQRGPRND
jgi:hypothetical protein